MSRAPILDDSDPIEDPSGDDGQLRIRIPNPKVYMARQSQWVGRRGKPRCDYCRSNNLKVSHLLAVEDTQLNDQCLSVSATEYCRPVITALGRASVNACILHSLHRRIEEFLGVIAVERKI